MKFSIVSILTIFLGITISGCDPSFHVDYKVVNETDASIKILVDHNGTTSDTNIISSGTSLIFLNDFGIGFTTSDYLDGLETLPFELSIFDKTGNSFNRSEEDIYFWQKIYPPKKSEGIGIVQLTVRPQDFE